MCSATACVVIHALDLNQSANITGDSFWEPIYKDTVEGDLGTLFFFFTTNSFPDSKGYIWHQNRGTHQKSQPLFMPSPHRSKENYTSPLKLSPSLIIFLSKSCSVEFMTWHHVETGRVPRAALNIHTGNT